MYLLASRQNFLGIPEYCSCIITTAENGNAIASPVAVPWLSYTRKVRQQGGICVGNNYSFSTFEKLDIECKDAFNAEISPNINAMKTIK